MESFFESIIDNGSVTLITINCEDGVVFVPEKIMVERCENLKKTINSFGETAGPKIVAVDYPKDVVRPIIKLLCTKKASFPILPEKIFQTARLAQIWGIPSIVERMEAKCMKGPILKQIARIKYAGEYGFKEIEQKLIKAMANYILDTQEIPQGEKAEFKKIIADFTKDQSFDFSCMVARI